MKRGTKQHPKFKHLARLLQLPNREWAIVGVLESIWYLAAEWFEDGGIGRWSDARIADAIGWDGDAGQLILCLKEAGWLDEVDDKRRLIVHDWMDHCPNFVSERFRKREERKAAAQGSQPVRSRGRTRSNSSEDRHESSGLSENVRDSPGMLPLSGPRPGSGSGPMNTEPAAQASAEAAPRPSPAAVAEEIVLRFDCVGGRKSGARTWGLTRTCLAELAASFPGVDAEQEARSAHAWCAASAARRKTADGMRGFLTNWFKREQNRGGWRGPEPRHPEAHAARLSEAVRRRENEKGAA